VGALSELAGPPPDVTPPVGRRWLPIVALVAIVALFGLKVSAYLAPDAVGPAAIHRVGAYVNGVLDANIRNNPLFHSCPAPERKLTIPGGWLCAAAAPPQDAYSSIFETYPADPNGREYVYASTNAGTVAAADDLMRGVVDIERYAPYRVGSLPTWTEDPYHDVYWRMNFYALRPAQNLLYAFRKTGDARYARRLVAIDESFFAHERSSPHAWSDDHAVAFRSMVLVDEWWQLRGRHQLTEAQSTRFLRELERTGQFLADVNHYQPQHNHGANEAAALLELAVDFPDLPNAGAWGRIARQRLATSIVTLVDQDGALIENSPYYDFYTLDKYWQISKFSQRAGISIAADFDARLESMVNYATYLLQPDSSVPLLGASLQAVIHDSGSYRQMAALNPAFEYVLTHGAKGRAPARTSTFFPHTGQAIFRSGWGKGSSFAAQSYLTFNVGAYRTAHSNLDALAITLYGGGIALLPGTGLYTYQAGPLRMYFHGTASHDTVVVDGRDQVEGSAAAGAFVTKDGVTYQTGESSLYEGVTHRRLVMMIDRKHFLVVDRLSSTAPHTYDQMFHLFPGATVTAHGLTVTGTGDSPAQSITIHQLAPGATTRSIATGRVKPAAGLCSQRYKKLLPCAAVTYEQRGTDATFTTLLTIGPPDRSFRIATGADAGTLHVHDGDRTLDIRLSESAATPEVATVSDPTPPKTIASEVAATGAGDWSLSGSGLLAPQPPAGTVSPATAGVTTVGTSSAALTDDAVRADLSSSNLLVRLNVRGVANIDNLELQLSNDGWTTTDSIDLRDGYRARYEGEWLTLSLGRSALRTTREGGWSTSGAGPFDWSRVDGIRFVVQARDGTTTPVTLSFGAIETAPQQAKGAVVFVFDDGYNSILPAARYLRSAGMAGDVAVIGKYVELPSQGHLTLQDLRMLQNSWGWNMVNHTQSHVDASLTYRHPLRPGAFEQDILGGAAFLERAGLNSAPNWLVYPHGAIDAALEPVVRRLYKFARVTDDQPEAYPFGDPLRVKTLEIQPADGEGVATGVLTSPGDVQRAVLDAKRFHTPLILTFHRIHSEAADPPGYPLAYFEEIVDGIRRAGIEVTTLSGLDALLGVPEDNHIDIRPGSASQIVVSLREHTRKRGLLSRLWDLA
jgi:hypothetical protein